MAQTHPVKTSASPAESRLTSITALREISQVIVGAFELQELLDQVVATLVTLSNADTCSIWLVDPDGKVRIRAARGYHERLLDTSPDYLQAVARGCPEDYTDGLPIPAEYGLGQGVTGRIVQDGDPVRTRGGVAHKRAHPQWLGMYDKIQWPSGGECRSFFGAPLRAKDRIIGVLKIENKRQADGELATAFTPEDEEVLMILANVIAVTIENQRLAEERRQQAEQAWRLVSARLAHKIGNQNFAVKGLVDGLLECQLPDEAGELATSIQQCALAIDQVVNEARRFSGPIDLSPTSTPLAGFVEATVRNHRVAGWDVRWTFQHDAPGLAVSLDANEIRHVLMELLENSQAFCPGEAHVTVRTRRAIADDLQRTHLHGDFALIEYCDNGPGVAPERKERIFDPFVSFRQGSGLGLSIVHQIIDAHHGTVVECGAKGEGARFLIFLPLEPGG